MPALTFITLMSRYSWGGSEELWYKTAIYAKKKGLDAQAHVFDCSKGQKYIGELEQAGIPVYYRRKLLSLKDRLFKKANADKFNPSSHQYYWRTHLNNKASLLVISQGSCYDCLQFPELFEILIKKKYNYVLINQHNFEHSPLEEATADNARFIFKNAKKVFFVSQRNVKVAERQLAATIENSELIFNPVKSTSYIPFIKSEDPLYIASVGRLECMNKGQDVLLEVLSQTKWKERSLFINFYGKGPDAAYIESLAAFYGIQKMIRLCGHVEKVEEIWKKNACLIMASIAEGTPLSLMEAMACGRAAIVTDVGGNAEWVEEGVNGFVADAPTPALLDQAMEKMWQSRHLLEDMGKKACQIFNERFPADAVSYFYDRLLAIN